jgi:hypothetical protein
MNCFFRKSRTTGLPSPSYEESILASNSGGRNRQMG